MTLSLALVLVLLVLLVVEVVRLVRADELGHRPPPSGADRGSGLPDRPYLLR